MSRCVRPPRYLNPHLGARWVRYSINGPLPEYACCYCVFNRAGRLLYVGQTLNLKDRFIAHRGLGTFPDDAYIKMRCGDRYGEWAMREARFIKRLRPPMNRRLA